MYVLIKGFKQLSSPVTRLDYDKLFHLAKEEFVILYNENSPDSIELANYYAQNRPYLELVNKIGLDIPQAIYPSMFNSSNFKLNLSGSDLDFPYEHCRKYDFIGETNYINSIKPALQTYLNNNPTTKYVVCMIDVPTNLVKDSFIGLSRVESTPAPPSKYLLSSLTYRIRTDFNIIIFYITASKLNDCKAIVDKLSRANRDGLQLYKNKNKNKNQIYTEDSNVGFYANNSYYENITSSHPLLSSVAISRTGSPTKRYRTNGLNKYNNFIVPVDADNIYASDKGKSYFFSKNNSVSAVGLNSVNQLGLPAVALGGDYGTFGSQSFNFAVNLSGYYNVQPLTGTWDNIYTKSKTGFEYTDTEHITLLLSGTKLFGCGNNSLYLLGLDSPIIYKTPTPLSGNFTDVGFTNNNTYLLSAGTNKWFVTGPTATSVGDYTLKDKSLDYRVPAFFGSTYPLQITGLPNKQINTGTFTFSLSELNGVYTEASFGSPYYIFAKSLGFADITGVIENFGVGDIILFYASVDDYSYGGDTSVSFCVGVQNSTSFSFLSSRNFYAADQQIIQDFGFTDVGIVDSDLNQLTVFTTDNSFYATYNTTIQTPRPIIGEYQKIVSRELDDYIMCLSANSNTWYKANSRFLTQINEKYDNVQLGYNTTTTNGVGVFLSAGNWYNNKNNFASLSRQCQGECKNRLIGTFDSVQLHNSSIFYGLTGNKLFVSAYNYPFVDSLLEPISANSEFPFDTPNTSTNNQFTKGANSSFSMLKVKGYWSRVIPMDTGCFALSAHGNQWYYFGPVYGFFGTQTVFNSNTGIYADYFGTSLNPAISSLSYFGSWGFNGRRFFPPHTNTQNLSNYGNFTVSNLLTFQNPNKEDGWYFLETIESFNGASGGGSYSALAGLTLGGWGNFPGNSIKDFITYKNSPAYERYYLTDAGSVDHGLSGSPIRHSTYTAWFSPSAFGGSNYENCPIVTYAHVSEPGFAQLDRDTIVDWYQGNTFFNVVSANITYYGSPQAFFIGDPLARIQL